MRFQPGMALDQVRPGLAIVAKHGLPDLFYDVRGHALRFSATGLRKERRGGHVTLFTILLLAHDM